MQILLPHLQSPNLLELRPKKRQTTLPVLKRDVLEIRFGKAQDIDAQARAFSQRQGEQLHQLILASSRELWHIFNLPPGASYARLKELERERLLARLNTPAYNTLTELLKPKNLAQIKTPAVGSHLQLLKDQGYIQPDQPYNRYIIGLQVDIRMLEIQLYELMDEGNRLGQTGNPMEQSYKDALKALQTKTTGTNKALLQKRNELAHAHGYSNFYDFQLAQQKLTFEDIERFYEKTANRKKQLKNLYPAKLSRYSQIFLASPMMHQPADIALYQEEGIIPQEQDLTQILYGLNIKTQQDLAMAAAQLIGQAPAVAKILRSISNINAAQFGSVGFFMPIDPPFEIGASADLRPKLNLMEANTFLHETLGHGICFMLLDPTLPPQFRDYEELNNTPFGFINEGMGRLWEGLVYNPEFWLGLGAPAEKVETLKKTLALEKLKNLLGIDYKDSVKEERNAYIGQDPKPWSQMRDQYPVYVHGYDMGIVWATQLEAAMKDKYGSILTPEAWQEIGKVLSLGKMLNWQEQIKLLTSKPKEIDRVVKLLRGTAADAQQGREEIRSKVSGKYFSLEAWSNKVQDLLDILTANTNQS